MKIADQVPQACSGCYQQHVDERHVDFEVAYDGPILGQENGALPYSVDDLVLCSSCLESAAVLLGLKRDDARDEEIATLQAERVVLLEETATQKAFADQLRAALSLAPAPDLESESAPTPEPEPDEKAPPRGRRSK